MENKLQEGRGLIEMSLAMLISGTIGITVLLSGQAASELIFFRCFFGTLILGIICLYRGLFYKVRLTKFFCLASLIGGVALLANWYFLFSAYSKTSVGIATTVYNTQPFMFVLLSAVFLREKITRTILLWLSVSFIGLCLVASTKLEFNASYAQYFLGIFQALIAALLYALASLATKLLKDYSPVLIAFFQLILGVVLFLPLTDFTQLTHTVNVKQMSAIVALGVIHTGVMYILLYGAIQKLAAYKVASLAFLYPAVALVIDYVFLEVRLVWVQIIGILLILLGAAGNNLQSIVAQQIGQLLATKDTKNK